MEEKRHEAPWTSLRGWNHLRVLTLGLLVVGFGSQLLVVGAPGNAPINGFPTVSIVAAPQDQFSGYSGVVAAASYAGRTQGTLAAPSRDRVALLGNGSGEPDGEYFPRINIVRGPGANGTPGSVRGYRLIVPTSSPDLLELSSPTSIAAGELNRPLDGQSPPGASEELIVGFNQPRASVLAIVSDFDSTAAATQPSGQTLPRLNGELLRFNCLRNSNGACMYGIDGSSGGGSPNPDRADPNSTVIAIALGNFDLDPLGRNDIAILADQTYDVNRTTTETGLGARLFLCRNFTPLGSTSLNFSCRGLGWQSSTAYAGQFDNCIGDCVIPPLGGNISVTPGPNGSLRILLNFGNTVVEVSGDINGAATPTPRAINYPSPVMFATYSLFNNDSFVDRLVQLQPGNDPMNQVTYDNFYGPIAVNDPGLSGQSLYEIIPMVEVCLGTSSGGCTVQRPLPVARGGMISSGVGLEYRQAARLVGVADVIGTSNRSSLDGARELVVVSSGAGLGANDPQSNYNLVETSVMTLGGDPVGSGSEIINLPASVSQIAAGYIPEAPMAGVLGNFWNDGTTGRGADVATVYSGGDVVFARNRFSGGTASKSGLQAKETLVRCPEC